MSRNWDATSDHKRFQFNPLKFLRLHLHIQSEHGLEYKARRPDYLMNARSRPQFHLVGKNLQLRLVSILNPNWQRQRENSELSITKMTFSGHRQLNIQSDGSGEPKTRRREYSMSAQSRPLFHQVWTKLKFQLISQLEQYCLRVNVTSRMQFATIVVTDRLPL